MLWRMHSSGKNFWESILSLHSDSKEKTEVVRLVMHVLLLTSHRYSPKLRFKYVYYLYFVYNYWPSCSCVLCIMPYAHRGQKSALDLLTRVKDSCNCMWMLGTQLRSSARKVHVLTVTHSLIPS